MRKNSSFIRMLAAVLSLLVLCAAFSIPAVSVRADGNYSLVLEDEANLLTSDEERSLKMEMEKLLPYGNVAFATAKTNPYGSTAALADQLFGDWFGYKADGVLFLIDMAKRQIYMYSCGALESQITVNDCNAISDNVYSYASDGNYFACAKRAFNQTETLLSTGKLRRPMLVTTVILLALMISSFIMLLLVKATMRLRSPSDRELSAAGRAFCETSSIVAIKTGTTRTYSPITSSESSGGGGGGFSGGGGFGGGGGGGGGHGGGHGF